MPYNIPISGLPGSMPLVVPSATALGSIFNLWQPKSGPWTVVIPMSTDSPCPAPVKVELLQDQSAINRGLVVVASQTFTITSTTTNCTLEVSDTSALLPGTCSTSGLMVRLTAEKCSICCPITGSLHATVTATIDCGCTTEIDLVLLQIDPQQWRAPFVLCDGRFGSMQLIVYCDDRGWTIAVIGNNNEEYLVQNQVDCPSLLISASFGVAWCHFDVTATS